MLIIFNDMIVDSLIAGPVVTELFIRGSKVKISTVSITQSSFQVPKDVRINCTLFLLYNSCDKLHLIIR